MTIAQTVRSSRLQKKKMVGLRRKLLKGYGGDGSGLSASLALYNIVSFVLHCIISNLVMYKYSHCQQSTDTSVFSGHQPVDV
jgi:hypothetical protein